MLDIKRIRKHTDEVAAGLAKRGYHLDVDAFNELDARRRALDMRSQGLLSERKQASRKVGELVKQAVPVDEAKQTTDLTKQGELYRDAERILLNTQMYAVPVNWYRGDYAYNADKWAGFDQINGIIPWEQITPAG